MMQIHWKRGCGESIQRYLRNWIHAEILSRFRNERLFTLGRPAGENLAEGRDSRPVVAEPGRVGRPVLRKNLPAARLGVCQWRYDRQFPRPKCCKIRSRISVWESTAASGNSPEPMNTGCSLCSTACNP